MQTCYGYRKLLIFLIKKFGDFPLENRHSLNFCRAQASVRKTPIFNLLLCLGKPKIYGYYCSQSAHMEEHHLVSTLSKTHITQSRGRPVPLSVVSTLQRMQCIYAFIKMRVAAVIETTYSVNVCFFSHFSNCVPYSLFDVFSLCLSFPLFFLDLISLLAPNQSNMKTTQKKSSFPERRKSIEP